MKLILAVLDPAGLPTLRIAATIFLFIKFFAGVYIYRNRRRFFYRDPEVDGFFSSGSIRATNSTLGKILKGSEMLIFESLRTELSLAGESRLTPSSTLDSAT